MRGGHPGWLLLNVWRPEVPMPMAVAPRVLENAAAAAVRLANWNPSGQHLGPHRFGAVHGKEDRLWFVDVANLIPVSERGARGFFARALSLLLLGLN